MELGTNPLAVVDERIAELDAALESGNDASAGAAALSIVQLLRRVADEPQGMLEEASQKSPIRQVFAAYARAERAELSMQR